MHCHFTWLYAGAQLANLSHPPVVVAGQERRPARSWVKHTSWLTFRTIQIQNAVVASVTQLHAFLSEVFKINK